MRIAMNGPFKIRPAPNGKVYVTWDDTWGDQPICDRAGGLRYFDDEREVKDFFERFDAEECPLI
jgi:hypothetical protein